MLTFTRQGLRFALGFSMTPGQVYTRLLEERSRLRATVAAVSSTLATVSHADELRESALCLRNAVSDYTDVEDQLLPEVLRGLDAWGAERVNQMFAEHGRRRENLVEELSAIDASGCDPFRVKRLLIELITVVLSALATEEEQLLRPDVLRDDDTNVDEFGG